MNYIAHTELVNNTLHDLFVDQFPRVVYAKEYSPDFKYSEFLRYFLESQDVLSYNSAGADRVYNYSVSYYFAIDRWTRRKYEEILMDRIDQLGQLFKNNVTYTTNGYKWHHAVLTIGGIDYEDKILYMDCNLEIYRFCELPSTVTGRYNVTNYERAVYG